MLVKVIYTKYSKRWLYTVAHTIDYVCSKINSSWFNPWFSFYFSSLCPAPFKAVLALPKMTHFAQTHRSVSFIWIVWSTLYVNLWYHHQLGLTSSLSHLDCMIAGIWQWNEFMKARSLLPCPNKELGLIKHELKFRYFLSVVSLFECAT